MSTALLQVPEYKSGAVTAAITARQAGSLPEKQVNKLRAPRFLPQHVELSAGDVASFYHLNAVDMHFKMCLSSFVCF